ELEGRRGSASRVVHLWPPGGTNCRSSSQIGQDGGGASEGVNWLPQVSQMKAGMTRPDTLTRCALSPSAPADATAHAPRSIAEAAQHAAFQLGARRYCTPALESRARR